MTYEEFQSEFSPVLGKWRNNYSPQQVERVFHFVQGINSWQFKLIVNQFLDGHRQAPLPRDFMDAARVYRANKNASEAREYRYECRECLDAGMLSLTDKTDGTKTYCRCNCEMGQKETWSLPLWSRDLGETYSRGPLTTADTGFIANQAGEIQVKDLDNLRDLWKEKIKIAEMYWGQNGSI